MVESVRVCSNNNKRSNNNFEREAAKRFIAASIVDTILIVRESGSRP
jgi:hypothetical protein